MSDSGAAAAKPVQMVSPRVQTPTTSSSSTTTAQAQPEQEDVSPVVAHVKSVIDKISSSINNQETEKRTGGPREIIRSPPALIPDEHPPPQQQPLQLTNKRPETTTQPAVTTPPSTQVTSAGTTPITIAPRSTPDPVNRPGPPPLIGNRPPSQPGGISTQSSPSRPQYMGAQQPRAPGSYSAQQPQQQGAPRASHPSFPIISQPSYPPNSLAPQRPLAPGQTPRYTNSTQSGTQLKRPSPVSAPIPQYNAYEPPSKARRLSNNDAQDRMRILQESRDLYHPGAPPPPPPGLVLPPAPPPPAPPGIPLPPAPRPSGPAGQRPISTEELELKRLEDNFRQAQEEYTRSQEKAKRDKLELIEKKNQMADILRKMNQIKEHEGTKIAKEAYRRIHGVLPPSTGPPAAVSQAPPASYPGGPPALVSSNQNIPGAPINIPHVIEIVPNGTDSPNITVGSPATVGLQQQQQQMQQPEMQRRRPSGAGHESLEGIDKHRLAAQQKAAQERVPRPAHIKPKPALPVSRMTVPRSPLAAHKKPRIHIKALLMRPILNPRKHRMYGEISPWTQRQSAIGPPSSIGPHHVIKATSLKDHPPIRPPMPAHYRPKKKNEQVRTGPPPMAHSNGPYYSKSVQRRASGSQSNATAGAPAVPRPLNVSTTAPPGGSQIPRKCSTAHHQSDHEYPAADAPPQHHIVPSTGYGTRGVPTEHYATRPSLHGQHGHVWVHASACSSEDPPGLPRLPPTRHAGGTQTYHEPG